jgi:hypothetical protein
MDIKADIPAAIDGHHYLSVNHAQKLVSKSP